MKKTTVWISIIPFLFLIFGGMLWGILKADRPYSDTENRYLAARPAFSWKSLFAGEFTKEYEAYVSDQFPQRDRLVGLKTRMEALLGKTETKNVWLADEEYLIVNHPAADFESELAEKNSRALAKAVSYYAEALGDDHVRVLLIPTASQILTAKLPRNSRPYDQSQYLEKVRAAIGQDTAKDIFVDIESVLSAHAEEYIFYRTDHHWTTLGAFYAYQAWAESLGLTPLTDSALRPVSEQFLGTTWSKLHAMGKADVISVYDSKRPVVLTHNQQTQTEGFYDWEALKQHDQYAVFLGGNDGLLEIRPPRPEATSTGKTDNGEPAGRAPVLLIVKDSFANCFIPYAAEHYETILVADLRYLNMSLQALAEQYAVTDVLILYNIQAFATDATVFRIAK